MALPQVAIVGRPNVGKSSLFNWLAGRRIAIVDPTPGVTRDRLTTPIACADHYFELVDTGGMGIVDQDNLASAVEQQIHYAIEQAQLLLFVVDARAGLAPLDEEIAQKLRSVGRALLMVANKCDTPELEPNALEFHRLGFGEVLCVSAEQKRGKKELLAGIARHLAQQPAAAAPAQDALKLAMVGRRNTGKSTFINCLAQEERTIVSEVPGTTRDSVDVRFERDGQTIVAIDTAGVRKKRSIRTDLEFYSLARAERSIRRADVVLLFLDAAKSVSQVDKQLAGYILENYKPAIFVVNKWDLLVKNLPTGDFADYLHKVFPALDFLPMAFVTAKTGRNVHAVLNLAQHLHKQASIRVGTGDLNRVLRWALDHNPPPMRQNRRPKIYFGTQVAANPPTIVLFTNGPQLFDDTYQRYLVKTFRDQLPFREVAIKLYLRHKHRDEPAEAETPRTGGPGRSPGKKKKGTSALWQDL